MSFVNVAGHGIGDPEVTFMIWKTKMWKWRNDKGQSKSATKNMHLHSVSKIQAVQGKDNKQAFFLSFLLSKANLILL
jgi:hypothetical protein